MWTTLEKSFHKSIKAGAPMQVMNHLRSRRFLAKSRTGKQSQLHNGMFHKGAGPTECSHWERNDEQVCHVTTGAAAVDAVLGTQRKIQVSWKHTASTRLSPQHSAGLSPLHSIPSPRNSILPQGELHTLEGTPETKNIPSEKNNIEKNEISVFA